MEGGLEADLGAALALGLEAGLELGAVKSVRSPNCLQEACVFRFQLYNFEAFPNLLKNLGNFQGPFYPRRLENQETGTRSCGARSRSE